MKKKYQTDRPANSMKEHAPFSNTKTIDVRRRAFVFVLLEADLLFL